MNKPISAYLTRPKVDIYITKWLQSQSRRGRGCLALLRLQYLQCREHIHVGNFAICNQLL